MGSLDANQTQKVSELKEKSKEIAQNVEQRETEIKDMKEKRNRR